MGLDRLVDELGRLWESTPTPDSSHFTVPEFERPADESDEGEQTWTLEAGD
jgi:hypothetical protein